MRIPNHKEVYKTVSEKYNIDLKLVDKIGSFIWSDLNDRISGFKNREIYMYKLGTWKFRKTKSENYVAFLRKKILEVRQDISKSDEDKEKQIKIMVDKIKKLKVLLDEWDEIIEEKKRFKNEQVS